MQPGETKTLSKSYLQYPKAQLRCSQGNKAAECHWCKCLFWVVPRCWSHCPTLVVYWAWSSLWMAQAACVVLSYSSILLGLTKDWDMEELDLQKQLAMENVNWHSLQGHAPSCTMWAAHGFIHHNCSSVMECPLLHLGCSRVAWIRHPFFF